MITILRNQKAAWPEAAVVLLLASVFVTAAQSDKNEGSKRSAAAGDETTRPQRRQLAGSPPGRFVPGFERLQTILTEDQRASLRETMQGQREKIRELEGKIRDARKDLLTAGLTEKFDEDAVRQKALAAAKLDAELTVLLAKALSQMRPALSAEQLEKLKSSPAVRGAEQPEPPRRPDIRRDEHGLPLKESAPARPNSAAPAQP